jgi:hypothetical protein
MTLELTETEQNGLIICLNCELRQVTGEDSHALNSVFRKIAGRDHDVYARFHPEKCKPNEPWCKKP